MLSHEAQVIAIVAGILKAAHIVAASVRESAPQNAGDEAEIPDDALLIDDAAELVLRAAPHTLTEETR